MARFDQDEYADMFRRLLPRGRAWDLSPNGVLMRFLSGISGIFAHITARARYLMEKEQFPNTTDELFTDWETELGLPDECRPDRETMEQRRQDILDKYLKKGGQSIAYFLELGRSMGLEITIEEGRPFRCGENTMGQPLQGEEWTFVWRITSLSTKVSDFKIGEDTMGTPLRSWPRNSTLECLFNRYKPEHTHLVFAYADGSGAGTLDDNFLKR